VIVREGARVVAVDFGGDQNETVRGVRLRGCAVRGDHGHSRRARPDVSPVQTFAGGGMRAAYCRDPDGNVFEIMQPGEWSPG
jgi:catechol 2,3-dioxygenase-like lactoylglutathione lyase family enzyme